MNRRQFLKAAVGTLATATITGCSTSTRHTHQPAQHPNIIYILADDLGYGDVGCYNPQSKIKTPNLDHMAAEGLRLTNAHATCAVCSPTRYTTLTGRYAWRTRLQYMVMPYFDTPLIESDRLTLAGLLKDQGYATAAVGKWHLGLGWQAKDGQTFDPNSWSLKAVDAIDFTQPLTKSPLDLGFDYFFGIGSANNLLPYCYLENDRVLIPPNRTKDHLYDGERGKGVVCISDDFDPQQIDQVFKNKASDWLNSHLNLRPDKPFFLYFAASAIHRPCLPDDEFIQSSSAGLHGDKTQELDAIVGELIGLLRDRNALDNTLIVFTSDNGPLPGDDVAALNRYAANDWGQKYHPQQLLDTPQQDINIKEKFGRPYMHYDHAVSGPYRGYKFQAYEGGTRVPYIVRWPGVVTPNTTSDQLIGSGDFFATLADWFDSPLSDNAAEDSISFLPVLTGRQSTALRNDLITTDAYGTKIIRQGDWKLIIENTRLKPDLTPAKNPGQLYNLKTDPAETTNLIDQHPKLVAKLTALYKHYETAGRSR